MVETVTAAPSGFRASRPHDNVFESRLTFESSRGGRRWTGILRSSRAPPAVVERIELCYPLPDELWKLMFV